MLTQNLSVVVDLLIKDVRRGTKTLDEALTECKARDIHVGRGTRSRLLRAEADRILRADDAMRVK